MKNAFKYTSINSEKFIFSYREMLQKVKPKIYDKKQKSIFLLSFPKYESKNDEILVGVL